MKTLLSADAATGTAPEDLTALSKEQLIARLTVAENTVADFRATAAQTAADEVLIREKMSVGLSREQAVAVIKRQQAHDAAGIK